MEEAQGKAKPNASANANANANANSKRTGSGGGGGGGVRRRRRGRTNKDAQKDQMKAMRQPMMCELMAFGDHVDELSVHDFQQYFQHELPKGKYQSTHVPAPC